MYVYIKFARFISLTTALLLFAALSWAQVIKGKVTDAVTNLPVANVSVYLNGTYKGTSSDAQGNFSFNSAETTIQLIISHVGYTTQTLVNYAGKSLNIALKPKTKQLREVSIGGDNLNRETEMRIFLTEFIGEQSKNCVISNPDDIFFNYNKRKDSLAAGADNPLIIRNKKLGYKITYSLEAFWHIPGHTFYKGNYFFTEDTAGLHPKDIKKIVKARDEAYRGSRMHFIRSLWANKLVKNDFGIYPYSKDSVSKQLIIDKGHVLFYRNIIVTTNNNKFIGFKDSLSIIYKKDNYSSLKPLLRGNDILIQSNGYYWPEITWTGDMGTQRVNQLLPYEFQPSNYNATEEADIPEPVNIKRVRHFMADALLAHLIDGQDSLLNHKPTEKLYLQIDKNTYGINDTLRLKAYLFNGSTLGAAGQSNIAYVEISDESNIVQVRRMIVLKDGLGWGSIALNKRDFPEGGYTLRAYTQWMRNFDESIVFKKQFFVTNLDRDKWLINFNSAVQDKTAQLHLQLTGVDKHAIANQQVLLGVKQDEAILRRDKPQTTSPFGGLDLAVAVRSDHVPVYASLHKGSYEDNFPVYKFPVIYNRPEKTDVQFMPEGGYFVAGINSIVGFKAIGENGKGANISGGIYNAVTNEAITNFKSVYKGMGSFAFMPQEGVKYKAIVDLPNGAKKEYDLPTIKTSGTVLSVSNPGVGDSVMVRITASPDMHGRYILLGQSRGLVCVAARVALGDNNTKILKVPKSAFATGITRFTLLNEDLNTLNERIIYIDHHDTLQIKITPQKNVYAPQDSIALQVEVINNEGNPVQGSFSMSVINDLQLNDDQNNSSIATSLLLTSDLKGNIEGPGYYFSNAPNHLKALDNLLLTQGWTGFDWKSISQSEKQPEFLAEPYIFIKGKVTNLFNKGVNKATVNLLSLKPFYSMDAQTDEKGFFILENVPQIDSAMYIRAKNAKGNPSTYAIDLDRPGWPSFVKNELQMPWYVNTDTVKLKITDTLIRNAEKLDKLEGVGGKVLKEVDIKEKKIVNGSHNLNGPGEADQVIDEHDIAKEKPMTLLELLKKKVKGFRTEGIEGQYTYFIGGEPIQFPPLHGGDGNPPGGFIFDGIQLRKAIVPQTKREVYELLNYYTSDDIKGIEVMYKGFTSSYELSYLTTGEMIKIMFPVPFIEITTRAGTGPYMKKAPADLVYKPIPAVSHKDFYRPAYPVKNSAVAAFDTRTTIHWEPNINTDKNGRATVTFYAAGQPATYVIKTEGTNMNGNVGSAVQKILIKANSL